MAVVEIADNVITTDVLLVGEGITGCCAAAKAAEHGLGVTIVEKSKLERSGNAGMGINYYAVGAMVELALRKSNLAKRKSCSNALAALAIKPN